MIDADISPFAVFAIVLLAFAIIIVVTGVRTVTQGYEYTVERFAAISAPCRRACAS